MISINTTGHSPSSQPMQHKGAIPHPTYNLNDQRKDYPVEHGLTPLLLKHDSPVVFSVRFRVVRSAQISSRISAANVVFIRWLILAGVYGVSEIGNEVQNRSYILYHCLVAEQQINTHVPSPVRVDRGESCRICLCIVILPLCCCDRTGIFGCVRFLQSRAMACFSYRAVIGEIISGHYSKGRITMILCGGIFHN